MGQTGQKQKPSTAPGHGVSAPGSDLMAVSSFHGQPWALAHSKTARWPFRTANEHVSSSHGQPLARTHGKTARWPLLAAYMHVHSFHGQPLARTHSKKSGWPFMAAFVHRPLVPWAPPCSKPLQHLEAAILGGRTARVPSHRKTIIA